MTRGRASRGPRLAGAALALAGALAVAGCSNDEPTASSTAPLEVTEGEGFTWNDFTVEEGWEIASVERQMGIGDPVQSPEIKGSIVNNAEEERSALFQVVMSLEGEERATISCSTQKLVQDQSGALLCPGFGAIMPEDYDALTVMEIRRDTGESDSNESRT